MARLDAARVILGSIGIADRGGTTIATQVNVEQQPRSPMAELLGHDPD